MNIECASKYGFHSWLDNKEVCVCGKVNKNGTPVNQADKEQLDKEAAFGVDQIAKAFGISADSLVRSDKK